MARARLPHMRRDGRPRRPARDATAPIEHWKARGLDSRAHPAQPARARARRPSAASMSQDHGLEQALDNELIELRASRRSRTARRSQVELPDPQHRPDRRARCSPARSRDSYGAAGLPDDTITLQLHRLGRARASAPSAAKGVTLMLEGDANDYIGKGLSGGAIDRLPAARARPSSPRRTSSSATWRSTARPAARPIFRGMAGERFCRPQQRRDAVVEGVGDHGCEYMTGGRGGRARPDRPQLRGRHERRHRLRPRRGRRLRRRTATWGWSISSRVDDEDDIETLARADREAPRLDRQRAGRRDARPLGRHAGRSSSR